MEILDYLKERRRRSKNNSEQKFNESKIAENLDSILEDVLTEDVKFVVFEVSDAIVQAIIEVIDKKPLIDKYIITQESGKNMFKATVRDITLY